jgi:hypothetical protein
LFGIGTRLMKIMPAGKILLMKFSIIIIYFFFGHLYIGFGIPIGSVKRFFPILGNIVFLKLVFDRQNVSTG